MKEKIQFELQRIEKENNVKILFAVESGSRAWGFPSKDSDYDVRFVYIHPVDWYLSINEKRDVIEYPINDALDISGWDIRKALRLFAKSNPALLEWIRSPIFYSKQSDFPDRLQKMSENDFDPKATIYHYLHMASKNYREFLQGERVKLKKYFYVLRPILACKWLEEKGALPPVEFERLITELTLDSIIVSEIEDLLVKKKAGVELDVGPEIAVLNEFLEGQIAYYQEYVKGIEKGTGIGVEKLDVLFRDMLFEIEKEHR
ncbi:nucleotidyltransferase domain-containing protein [Bacillus sp. DX1.1]|uniref:nucleotidyltransferase domain-containing protein n=1 Tax=unclassified Bacillus (in: firmicutes) TaxID=185979 RepID=UPI002570607C|nr:MULTISPECIES: nucleotidyltransferase domain-containing protein [unclassified Bacillus (in: firmicutes)]MDM5153195.1 nucleotidyltransferase domain-containing protein [Bacillus sp. DX1.1]WJE82158.1 nucleotidyltransferase domain-containing protein [Bacillus sp. DX3.1]